jgi:hypothetical protein
MIQTATGVRFRLATKFNGAFLSFYSDKKSVGDVYWGNPGSASSQRFDNNISQTPENASGENGVRHSIAPDIGSATFKNWFADSKVVDQNGEPLVVYHGSSAVFYAFDPKKIKSGAFGKGIYLSPSKANTRA